MYPVFKNNSDARAFYKMSGFGNIEELFIYFGFDDKTIDMHKITLYHNKYPMTFNRNAANGIIFISYKNQLLKMFGFRTEWATVWNYLAKTLNKLERKQTRVSNISK